MSRPSYGCLAVRPIHGPTRAMPALPLMPQQPSCSLHPPHCPFLTSRPFFSWPVLWIIPSTAPTLDFAGLLLLILKDSIWAAPSLQETFPTSWLPSLPFSYLPDWVRGPLLRLHNTHTPCLPHILHCTDLIWTFFLLAFSLYRGAVSHSSLSPEPTAIAPRLFVLTAVSLSPSLLVWLHRQKEVWTPGRISYLPVSSREVLERSGRAFQGGWVGTFC